MTDGDNKDRDADGVNERMDENGNWKILYQFTARLKDILNPDAGENAGLLKKSDMPVPTWLVNDTDETNGAYWQKVNRTGENGEEVALFGGEGVQYNQEEDTWPTEYAGHISKVVEISTEADTEAYEFTRALRDELTDYTRYDVTISYGNGLYYRLDYSAIQAERYAEGNTSAVGTVVGTLLDGTEAKGEFSMQDVDLDNGYKTDLLLYVPESAGDSNIPVVVVFHGGSQSSTLFFDSTAWWQTAAKEGFALALSTRTLHNMRTGVDFDIPVFDKTLEILAADGRFDMGRIYSTGQSMGSAATVKLAEQRTNDLAAVISSNAGTPSADEGVLPIPAGLVIGEGNYANRGIPGYVADTNYPEDATVTLVRSTEAAAAGADIYWDASENSKGEPMPANMNHWVNFFLAANGLDAFSLRDTVVYSNSSSLNQGTDEVGTLAEWQTNNARVRQFYWDNEDGIPVMTYMFSLFQAHNCQPHYRQLMWDFLKHYRVDRNEDGTVTRYYSESAFAEDDAVVILDK